jgi:hypothetical protein
VSSGRELERFLPDGYGEVVAEPALPRAFDTAIVIPVYGRASYLDRCLTALARSRLSDCVICLVDETLAAHSTQAFDGFLSFAGIDSPGGDISGGTASPEGTASLEATARAAQLDPSCLAFTSRGYRKSTLTWMPRRSPGQVLYVKKTAVSFPFRQALLRWLSDAAPEPAATEIVRSWTCPRVPVVKIFKAQHASMFDSLAHGLRLMIAGFQCRTLVCLDSDALVKVEWLEVLRDLYRRLQEQHKPLIVSGFHTASHPTLSDRADHRFKSSLGGINLFFDLATWKSAVEPNLNGHGWDHKVSRSVTEQGGALVTTRPSVVQHIGRWGVWSSPLRYDRAEDF